MLDSILDAVKGQVTSAITDKTGLDLGQAEKAIPLAGDSITDGITGALSGGNVDGILGMLKSATGDTSGGGLLENVVYKGIAGNFINKATSSLGLSEGVAGTISSLALPMIMEKIGGATKAAGDTDGIDAGSMMSALGLDAGSLLGNLAGDGAAGDLLGAASKLLGDQGGSNQGGGGLLGKLGGLFKK
ncbi:MAG: hypothetical protein AAGA62_00850 [Bacteroidota bacterium]